MFKDEDFSAGDDVVTPSGRQAVVKKVLIGASKHDHFTRIVCRYAGGGPKDLVTLQPHQLKRAPAVQNSAPPIRLVNPFQMAFDFA